MPARCIICREEFNRKIQEDKLKCPACQEPEQTPPKWKEDLKKIKDKKGKK